VPGRWCSGRVLALCLGSGPVPKIFGAHEKTGAKQVSAAGDW
jgi:hypothetical protein